MSIMWGGFLAVAGWLWVYLFGKQFLFNLRIAYPMIRKMRDVQDDLISGNAKRYTTVSVVVCILMLGLSFLVLLFKALYLKICFFAGAILCFILLFPITNPSKKEMFELFCTGYYRFVPDDALRTAIYNKKPSQMKLRLHDMGLSTAWIPSFDKDKK